ncbi:glycosyltransferase family A protein [Stenotrophomonas maltophilia]|uniref:glycosyltransferase family A protein n=1 Tax=Stenotrophomonas maltophilia TaxID=40324 RepID=UPI0021C24973|nr:glycosyltransferase family A protein [Stenotrophomonas maltophilia]UXL30896.1 glycosyltransferase family 2 protein [Stenotrophomonas maltophilia]
MLTLLTATGARPAAWALCERWMARQDYAGPVRWIIVDDGPEPQPVTFRRDGWQLVLVRSSPHWAPGQNTQARNLLKGLAAVDPADSLVIIEDDDWYAADWLTTVAVELEHAELVGEHRARYYNVEQRRGRQLANTGHASLCSTAMRGSALRDFADACRSRPKFIDLELWRRPRDRRLFGGHRVVGIKGLPGRGGIGMGHDPDFKGEADAGGALLRDWIGEDAEVYL